MITAVRKNKFIYRAPPFVKVNNISVNYFTNKYVPVQSTTVTLSTSTGLIDYHCHPSFKSISPEAITVHIKGEIIRNDLTDTVNHYLIANTGPTIDNGTIISANEHSASTPFDLVFVTNDSIEYFNYLYMYIQAYDINRNTVSSTFTVKATIEQACA